MRLVARPASKKERLENAGARASLGKERYRLRKVGAWNEKGAREWSDVAAEARKSGEQWLEPWKNMRDPVCLFILALLWTSGCGGILGGSL